jgi:hypothetical protein
MNRKEGGMKWTLEAEATMEWITSGGHRAKEVPRGQSTV